jgi:hypothetical protein
MLVLLWQETIIHEFCLSRRGALSLSESSRRTFPRRPHRDISRFPPGCCAFPRLSIMGASVFSRVVRTVLSQFRKLTSIGISAHFSRLIRVPFICFDLAAGHCSNDETLQWRIVCEFSCSLHRERSVPVHHSFTITELSVLPR